MHRRLLIRPLAAIGFLALLAGCATNTYPKTPSLSLREAQVSDCPALARQYEQTRQYQQGLTSATLINVRTYMTASVDFGLGNILAYADARGAAKDRMGQISIAMAAKHCRTIPRTSTIKEEAKATAMRLVTTNPLAHRVARLAGAN